MRCASIQTAALASSRVPQTAALASSSVEQSATGGKSAQDGRCRSSLCPCSPVAGSSLAAVDGKGRLAHVPPVAEAGPGGGRRWAARKVAKEEAAPSGPGAPGRLPHWRETSHGEHVQSAPSPERGAEETCAVRCRSPLLSGATSPLLPTPGLVAAPHPLSGPRAHRGEGRRGVSPPAPPNQWEGAGGELARAACLPARALPPSCIAWLCAQLTKASRFQSLARSIRAPPWNTLHPLAECPHCTVCCR